MPGSSGWEDIPGDYAAARRNEPTRPPGLQGDATEHGAHTGTYPSWQKANLAVDDSWKRGLCRGALTRDADVAPDSYRSEDAPDLSGANPRRGRNPAGGTRRHMERGVPKSIRRKSDPTPGRRLIRGQRVVARVPSEGGLVGEDTLPDPDARRVADHGPRFSGAVGAADLAWPESRRSFRRGSAGAASPTPCCTGADARE